MILTNNVVNECQKQHTQPDTPATRHLKRGPLCFLLFSEESKQHHRACMMGRQTEQLELLPGGERVGGCARQAGQQGWEKLRRPVSQKALSRVRGNAADIWKTYRKLYF